MLILLFIVVIIIAVLESFTSPYTTDLTQSRCPSPLLFGLHCFGLNFPLVWWFMCPRPSSTLVLYCVNKCNSAFDVYFNTWIRAGSDGKWSAVGAWGFTCGEGVCAIFTFFFFSLFLNFIELSFLVLVYFLFSGDVILRKKRSLVFYYVKVWVSSSLVV